MLSESTANEDLEPVSLGSPSSSAAAAAASATESREAVVTDPWAIDESTTAGSATPTTTHDGNTQHPPSDTQEAISKLQVSSRRLATNLDQQLGLSKAWDTIGSSVKTADERTHVSDVVKSAGSTIGNWFSVVDQQFQISATSKTIGSSIVAKLPTEEISAGISNTTRALYEFDESHGITKTTASTLAGGADYLTNNIVAPSPTAETDDGKASTVDADGLPTSFQK